MKKIIMNKYVILGAALLIGILIGYFISTSTHQHISTSTDQHTNEVWTCSMHPSVRQPEPGKCPICGMDLIPLENLEGDEDPMAVKMSATAVKLANIQTMVIGGGKVVKEIRLNGKIQADERNISSQSAHIPGRIEQLLVNFTGEYVQKGAVIAYMYSPELVTAQQEIFEAYKIRESQPALYQAAREKLKNWKLNDTQIDKILSEGKPTDRFPLVADMSGIVLKRNVRVGDYVSRGESIYELVDLSRVWVLFDVYESDIHWIKKGDEIQFTVQSLPGETFSGKVTFIDPLIDPATRVATARVEMKNPGHKLKPEMFVTGVVKSKLEEAGEITVPKSAVMWTGERSIVYLNKTSEDGVSFVLQEVVLGPSLGDSYVIKEGLEQGMEVVVNGTFTIDAAAQLAGKPSMMNPEGGPSMTGHDHSGAKSTDMNNKQRGQESVNEEFKQQLIRLIDPYLELKDALVSTDASAASAAGKNMARSLKKVDMSLLDHNAHDVWMPLYSGIATQAGEISLSDNVETQRKAFSVLTGLYLDAINTFDVSGLDAYYQYCPMAFNDKGGYWISKTEEILNPYFGSKMLRCGETVEEIE